MTVQEFIKLHKEKNPNSYYFDEGWLAFFGECIETMELQYGDIVNDDTMEKRKAYQLTSLQTNCPDGLLYDKITYFDAETLQVLYTMTIAKSSEEDII